MIHCVWGDQYLWDETSDKLIEHFEFHVISEQFNLIMGNCCWYCLDMHLGGARIFIDWSWR